MPALQRVKKQAQGTTCLSNLKQIGIALQMYAQECDDYIPRALDNLQARWILVFMPFLGEKYRGEQDYRKVDIYQCPSFPTTGAGSNKARNIEQTVAELEARYGPKTRLCVIPEGPQTIPYVEC